MSKGSISVEENRFTVNGKSFETMPSLGDLKVFFGKSRIIEGSINNLYIWDRQGICVFQDSENEEVIALHFSLVPDPRKNRPNGIYRGSITDLATPLVPGTSRGILLEKFAYQTFPGTDMIQTPRGAFLVSLHFGGDDLLDTVEISRRPNS